jgi:putative flippase GtrA
MVGWEDFIVQAAATLLGVICGIPVALWLNKQYSTFKKKDERKTLIGFLKENLEDNQRILKEMQHKFASNFVVLEYLNIGSWPLFSQKINILNNFELQRKIIRTYYNLEQLSRKIDRQFEMHFSTFRAMQSYPQDKEHLKMSIMGQIGMVNTEIEEILKEIPKQINLISIKRFGKGERKNGKR